MSVKFYIELTGEDNPSISDYDGNLKKIDLFCKSHNIFTGHFKHTCPNPHSGERTYGQRIWGMIIDTENRVCLYTDKHEFLAMEMLDSSGFKLSINELLSVDDPFHKYRGKIAGNKYGL